MGDHVTEAMQDEHKLNILRDRHIQPPENNLAMLITLHQRTYGSAIGWHWVRYQLIYVDRVGTVLDSDRLNLGSTPKQGEDTYHY